MVQGFLYSSNSFESIKKDFSKLHIDSLSKEFGSETIDKFTCRSVFRPCLIYDAHYFPFLIF